MSTYRPQSPDLSTYAPQSPDLTGLQPPDFGAPYNQQSAHHFGQARFGRAFGGNGNGFAGGSALSYSPTSIPQQQQEHWEHNFQQSGMAAMQQQQQQQQRFKGEDDDDYMPDAPAVKRPRKGAAQQQRANGGQLPQQPTTDPTLGVQLKTSFPVARIKRIMQHDEDIGKVAQVTPHVVSRALELFMIALISASAQQSRGGMAAGGTAGGKGPKKILAQHMKKAILADQNFDFLQEIAEKVPDAPTKASKKEEHSDSEEEEKKKPAKKKKSAGKKRKDSGDDF